MTIQLLHRQTSLQDESPMHDFANEISQRPSSTPNHATITSSFPENDQLIVNVLDNETYDNDYDDVHDTNNNNNNNNNDDDWDETDDEDETESYYATRSPTHRHHQQRSLSQQSRQSQQEQLEEQSQRHSRRLKRKESCSSIYSTSSTHESRQRSSSTQNKFKPQVLFSSNITNDTKKKYTRFIRNSGGSIVYDWEKCTHLITNEFRNTINILCTYLSGKFVLSEEWIKDSILQSKFLDEEDYLLCQQPENNFFKSKKLYFTDSFINHANGIKETDRHQLARASSAKV
ncbi:BRCT domain-containing protein [Cunninghamella echinulata]|nr:BRCT domain-containing protein [Cunninghamella echinulata]